MLDRYTDEEMLTGFPSKDRPWLKYYKKRPEDLVYPHKTLWQYAYDNNICFLNDIALQYFDRKINYETFFENVYKAAKSFVGMGVRSGDIVTIMSMHTPETIYTIYGLNFVGAVANLVYPTLTESELLKTLSDTHSKALFVLDAIYEKISDFVHKISIPIIVLSVDGSMPFLVKNIYRLKKRKKQKMSQSVIAYCEFLNCGNDVKDVSCSTDSSAPAVIVYTSGTTGDPKGVVLSNDNLNIYAEQDYAGLLEFIRGKDSLFLLPPFTGVGISHLHVQISAGITTIIQIDLNANAIHKNLFKYKPYCFMTGPALVENFLTHKKKQLCGLKYYINGGGKVPDELINQVNSFLHECSAEARFSNGYGMTESTSALCLGVNEMHKLESVGIPFIDTNVKVIDTDSGKELKYGAEGELWFSSPNLMTGYYNNDIATEKIIQTDEHGKRWLRTGDLGRVDTDGFVYITGRIKRIYVTKTKDNIALKLFPQQIEDLYSKVEEIAECGVVVKEDKERMNVAIVFLSLKDGMRLESTTMADLIEKYILLAKTDLPDHMQPAEIHIIDAMPVTPSGKIDYRELERKYREDKPANAEK